MTAVLPRVGARIKVTFTRDADGETMVHEGRVASLTNANRCVAFEGGTPVWIGLELEGWTVMWEEIEAPKLPSEPPMWGLVAIATDGPSRIFRRYDGNLAPTEYMEVSSHRVPTWSTWAQLCEGGTPVRLVAETEIADLVAAAKTWAERITDPVRAYEDETDRALIDAVAKYGAGSEAS